MHDLLGAFQIHDNAHELAGRIVDGKGAAVLADAIDAKIPWPGVAGPPRRMYSELCPWASP